MKDVIESIFLRIGFSLRFDLVLEEVKKLFIIVLGGWLFVKRVVVIYIDKEFIGDVRGVVVEKIVKEMENGEI